jgi:hypothetical protein
MCLFTNPTDVFESHPWPKRLDVCQKQISFLKLGRQRKCDSRSRALWELRSCSTEWGPRLEGWEFRWTAFIVSRENSNIQKGLLVDALQQACRLLGIPVRSGFIFLYVLVFLSRFSLRLVPSSIAVYLQW